MLILGVTRTTITSNETCLQFFIHLVFAQFSVTFCVRLHAVLPRTTSRNNKLEDMNKTRPSKAGLPVLLVTFLFFVAQAASRPSTENESDIASLPPDADNVEFHHVKVVDGVMHEDHPVVMYKEDFVNEDYDPSKNETKVHHRKLFKGLQRIRHHHLRPPTKPVAVEEKIVFDVLPESPLILGDDDSVADKYEVAQLVQPLQQESPQKYPKKYHSRQRRQADNPYVRKSYKSDFYGKAPAPYYLPVQPQYHYQRVPVVGKKPKYQGKLPFWQTPKPSLKPTSIGNRDDFGEDNENSLFHNSNPDDADFSIFDQPRPDDKVTGGGNGINWQSPPVQESEPAPVFGSSQGRRPTSGPARRPDIQFPPWPPTTSRPEVWSPSTTRRPAPPPQVTSSPPAQTTARVSNCVWAIVNCCSQGSNKIRYNCFEEFGCHGAFWGVNPCADNIRDRAIASLTRSSK
ncbi:uncharacterized protein LOC115761187 isoform X2 [Drosophila novamexicana]|uniref:uncharacterized protein LOC115761187 isoform X2 n=1 Tax=Drosophila novamexicana TaxID=47314 RepID=UPI0011E5979C|nr:uncharacterized protein LOC115761187 isoform X2 [Drosophila novamexicana]